MNKPKTIVRKSPEETTQPVAPKRVYGMNQEIDTDLYKLEVAFFQKNISWNKIPNLIPVEHCHFYHTYDSAGRKLEKSNAVGGHTHAIATSVDSEGNLVATCGPCIGGHESDRHVHAVRYIKSDKAERRRDNPEAIKVADALGTM